MRIVIGEDEVLIAEHLRDIVEGFKHEVVGLGHHKEEIIRMIDRTKPDLVLLDIHMEGKFDGIEIGEYVRNNFQMPIIYITAHSNQDIVHKALHTKPSGYIIKPFKPMDVFTALEIAVDKFSKSTSENFILVKDAYKTIKVYLFDILYLKSDNNYVEIHTQKTKYIERSSLENMLEGINSPDFVKVHRSYAINLSYANKFTARCILVKGTEIPVSRKYSKQLKVALFGK